MYRRHQKYWEQLQRPVILLKQEIPQRQFLWIAIMVLSAAGIIGIRIWNKKKQVKRLGIEEKKEEEK